MRAGEDVLLLRNTTVARHKLATDTLFMLKFYPSKLEAVLGINQMQFTSRLASLTQALPTSLLAQLKYTLSFAERVDLLESFLLRAFQRSARPTHYVRLVHQAIADYQASSL